MINDIVSVMNIPYLIAGAQAVSRASIDSYFFQSREM
jgi:hypothetical protein